LIDQHLVRDFKSLLNYMRTDLCLYPTNTKYVILLDHPWILR
jgi:hypothetical protein